MRKPDGLVRIVLAPASPWRPRSAPRPNTSEPGAAMLQPEEGHAGHAPKRASGTYRPWAELLKRTFGVDVLACPKCHGRMKLVAMVTDPKSIARTLAALGELTEVPDRSPSRGPPYWKSTVLRRKALGDEA